MLSDHIWATHYSYSTQLLNGVFSSFYRHTVASEQPVSWTHTEVDEKKTVKQQQQKQQSKGK